jgi:hypothetical protein
MDRDGHAGRRRLEEGVEVRRYAIVTNARTMFEVTAYLPTNYAVVAAILGRDERMEFLICGHDVAGWTLDSYVIPRLGSGLMHAREITEGAALAEFGPDVDEAQDARSDDRFTTLAGDLKVVGGGEEAPTP